MSTTQTWDQGRIVERVEDNGDGTGTRTTYDTEGQVTGTEQLTGLPVAPPPAPPTNAERFAAIPAAQAEAILNLSGGLLMQAGAVWAATVAMSNEAPGKAALRPIAETLLTAALPLLDET